MSKPTVKLPRTEAADISRLALQEAWLMFGLAGLMLFLLLLFSFLAAKQGKTMGWGVIIGWLLFFLAWPAGMGVWQWRRYQQALELESEHLFVIGKVIGFAHEVIGGFETAPDTDVYWVVFTIADGEPVKQKVSLATWQHLKADDAIEVKVSPRNRRICRAELT